MTTLLEASLTLTLTIILLGSLLPLLLAVTRYEQNLAQQLTLDRHRLLAHRMIQHALASDANHRWILPRDSAYRALIMQHHLDWPGRGKIAAPSPILELPDQRSRYYWAIQHPPPGQKKHKVSRYWLIYQGPNGKREVLIDV